VIKAEFTDPMMLAEPATFRATVSQKCAGCVRTVSKPRVF
jgi:hypothetical protein